MIRKAIANRRRRKWYRRLLEGGIVNLTEAQIRRLEAVGEDVEIIFGHLDWPGVCHVRLPPPANQFQTLTQDTFDRLSEYKARAEAAEQSDREAHEALLHTAEQLKAAERKLARAKALRDECAGQHGQCWNAIFARRLDAALDDEETT